MSDYFVRVDIMFTSSEKTAKDIQAYIETEIGRLICEDFFTKRIKRKTLVMRDTQVGVCEE